MSNDKFNWSPDQITVLNPDGSKKVDTPKTPSTEKPTVSPDRSDRFSWSDGEVEVLNSDGTKKENK